MPVHRSNYPHFCSAPLEISFRSDNLLKWFPGARKELHLWLWFYLNGLNSENSKHQRCKNQDMGKRTWGFPLALTLLFPSTLLCSPPRNLSRPFGLKCWLRLYDRKGDVLNHACIINWTQSPVQLPFPEPWWVDGWKLWSLNRFVFLWWLAHTLSPI